jgi:signal peptidase I
MMMSLQDKSTDKTGDRRTTVYFCLKALTVAICAALIVKFFLFDTIAIKTDQMSPSLLNGDRVLLLRTPFLKPIIRITKPERGIPLVFMHPLMHGNYACLRSAAIPGDSVVVSYGQCIVLNKPNAIYGRRIPDAEALPGTYSPRDTLAPYRIPVPGDVMYFDSSDMRDFIFSAAIVKQENPEKNIRIKPSVVIDGKIAVNLTITDFSLYKGSLDTLPERYDFDWFFWDRLHKYFLYKMKDRKVSVKLGLFDGNEQIRQYRVMQSFIFLIADDWNGGFDSRYFGPVPYASVKGRPICVLWSLDNKVQKTASLRTRRFIKIVK